MKAFGKLSQTPFSLLVRFQKLSTQIIRIGSRHLSRRRKISRAPYIIHETALAPQNGMSGGKVLRKKTRKVVSRLATALRLAASTLRESDSYLGAQFRRLRSRLGSPKAITAMAAKQARLVYRMLKFGQEYVDKGTIHYEEKYRQQKIKLISKQAAQHGFVLVPLTNLA
jgi:transposase